MTVFIDFQISVKDNNKNEEKNDKFSDSDSNSLKSFIDDNDEIENDRTFYQNFENATTSIDDVLKEEYTSIDDVLKEEYDKSIVDIQKINISNFCETSEEEIEIDKLRGTEKRIEKFKETFFPVSTDNDDDENNYDSFVNAIFLQ